MKISRIVSRVARGIWYFPKTLYVNFRCLPLKQALKLPIIMMGSTRLIGIKKGSIYIDSEASFGMINIGSQNTAKRGILTGKKSSLIVENEGQIIFKGSASIGRGSSLCASGGKIVFGDKFSCNVNCFFYCNTVVTFGEDVLLGWNINVRDNDGHPLIDNDGNIINEPKPIWLKDHVWVASYVDIMKGVTLEEGTIVGTRSLVTKSNIEQNTIIAGIPARVIKHQIFWKHNLH